MKKIILLCGLFLLMGCKSTPCVPEIIVTEKLVPVPCVITLGEIKRPVLEGYPPFEPTKEWALEIERIEEQNRIKTNAYIDALLLQKEEHNRLEPQCAH